MGIAALVIGILSAIMGFVPLCGVIALVPALVGLALGIVDVMKKSKQQQPKGVGLAGIILNAAAIAIIVIWSLVFAKAVKEGAPQIQQALEAASAEMAAEMEKAAAEIEGMASEAENAE